MSEEYQEEIETGVTDPAAGGEEGDEQPITREAFIAMRNDLTGKIDQLKDQTSLYKTQLTVLQSGRGAAAPEPADNDPFSGREEDDVITVAEMRRIMSQMSSQIGGSLGEARLAADKPDYTEVVQTHLPNYLQSNPEMIQVLRSLPPHSRPGLAYLFGTLDPNYQAKKNQAKLAKETSGDATRIAANKAKPNMAGKGGGSPLSRAGHYETMDDAELERTISQVKMGSSRR
jgi:hypothetical protein